MLQRVDAPTRERKIDVEFAYQLILKKISGEENSDLSAYVSRANKFTKSKVVLRYYWNKACNVSRPKKEEKREKWKGNRKRGEKKEGKNLSHVNYMLFTTFYMEII